MPPLPLGYNPATWMLEVSGGGAKMHIAAVDMDFAAAYRRSELCAQADVDVPELVAAAAAANSPLSLATRYAVPFAQQTKMVIWKQAIVYWYGPAPAVGSGGCPPQASRVLYMCCTCAVHMLYMCCRLPWLAGSHCRTTTCCLRTLGLLSRLRHASSVSCIMLVSCIVCPLRCLSHASPGSCMLASGSAALEALSHVFTCCK